MEIIWYGHACFRLKSRQTTVVTDPYNKTVGLNLPNLKADIVTVSHNTPHHNYVEGVNGDFIVVDRPGEYEIKGTFITGICMERPKDDNNKNNLFVVDMDNITLCHLGNLNKVPTQNQVEDMGNIDILLTPVGGHNALNATQAAELISLIEPRIIIPMHYHLPGLTVELAPIDKFLKEMGITNAETLNSLKLTQANLSEETQVILLNAKL